MIKLEQTYFCDNWWKKGFLQNLLIFSTLSPAPPDRPLQLIAELAYSSRAPPNSTTVSTYITTLFIYDLYLNEDFWNPVKLISIIWHSFLWMFWSADFSQKPRNKIVHISFVEGLNINYYANLECILCNNIFLESGKWHVPQIMFLCRPGPTFQDVEGVLAQEKWWPLKMFLIMF